MQKRTIYNIIASFAVTAILTACAGNAPAPVTNNSPQISSLSSDVSSTEGDEKSNHLSSSNKSLSIESHGSSSEESSSSSMNNPEKKHDEKVSKASDVTDPYVAFPTLAEGVFAHAQALIDAGLTDSASTYLERFRIIKPLWNEWENKADSMLNMIGKFRAEKAKLYEPMVFEIQNMNRAHAAYSMVAETADSLIALAPGDSLTNWATAQKQTAYKNTFAKAQKEYSQIKSQADDQAQFAAALAQAEKFQMRYRDFEDTLHIQALIDYIAELAAQNDPAAAKYWEKNDPAKALAQADALIAADKFKEAKELLNKLKASKLRKEANDRLQMLGDAYCNKQRKETSQIFAKAQKQKDEAKKRELLKQAIAPLDKCLSEYPNSTQHKKVQENKEFLEKELAK